jgi:hypothetical protein
MIQSTNIASASDLHVRSASDIVRDARLEVDAATTSLESARRFVAMLPVSDGVANDLLTVRLDAMQAALATATALLRLVR